MQPVAALLVHRVEDLVRRVEADQVEQRQRAHRVAAAVAHRGVDVLAGGVLRLVHRHGVVEVAEQQGVGDEAGLVAADDGVLAELSASASTSSSTSGSVTTVRTISTSFCTGAGLKKCTPMTRPGWELAVEISVTESEEVLVARMRLGRHDRVELAEDVLLDLEGLRDGLDDEVRVGERVEVGGEGDPAEQVGLLVLR